MPRFRVSHRRPGRKAIRFGSVTSLCLSYNFVLLKYICSFINFCMIFLLNALFLDVIYLKYFRFRLQTMHNSNYGNASVVWWSEFLSTVPEVRVRFLELTDFLRSSGFGAGPTQPREHN
jgi:hypothetical protein